VKVAVLTGAYPAPSEPTRAVYIENLTRALVEEGGGGAGSPTSSAPVEATVVAPRVAPSDPLLEMRGGIRVRRFRYPSGGRRLKEIPRPSPLLLAAYAGSGLRAIIEEARRGGAEIILCHWVLPAGPAAAAASALLGVPLVVLAHGSDLNRHAVSSRFRRAVARWVLGRARLVLAVSEDLRRIAVERFGVPPERSGVLPMGVDGGLFAGRAPDAAGDRRAVRRSLGLDPEAPLLLFVGDLLPEKGVLEIAAAVETLRRRGVAACAAFLGDGPLRNGAGPLAAGDGLVFRGRVPQADLPRWHEAADLLVLPSASEGTPVTVMEALSSGLPVVASRVGGIPDLIEDGQTGWLVPPRDARALAGLLEGLLRNPETLGAARRRLAAAPPDHSARSRARELREALARVLAEGTHGD
jgi:glycosyltransferase involved in cell wall biosynthesis